MLDFNKHLMNDEKILWQDRPNPGKGAKIDSISGSIFIIVFMIVIQALLIWSVVTGTGDGANGVDFTFILFFAITLLFQGLIIGNIIYNTFIKPKTAADDYYCITNKRALKYESKKNKLVYGYLDTYEDIGTMNVKNGYGDVFLQIVIEESGNDEENIKKATNVFLNPDPTNMPFIIFESIKDPGKVVNLIRSIKK